MSLFTERGDLMVLAASVALSVLLVRGIRQSKLGNGSGDHWDKPASHVPMDCIVLNHLKGPTTADGAIHFKYDPYDNRLREAIPRVPQSYFVQL